MEKKFKIWQAKKLSYKIKGKYFKNFLIANCKNCSIMLQKYEIIE